MAETLRQKQSRFASMTCELIQHAFGLGYEVTLGEAERRREPSFLYDAHVKAGSHPNSLHFLRLALDLNLFKDGKYLSSTESHRPLGEYWESIGGTWGGRFGDGNHYSLEHLGVK